tara:strand:+ start:2636 stop:2854 length:219 start_codon:yes stop_codon:yes gene_type:complete
MSLKLHQKISRLTIEKVVGKKSTIKIEYVPIVKPTTLKQIAATPSTIVVEASPEIEDLMELIENMLEQKEEN